MEILFKKIGNTIARICRQGATIELQGLAPGTQNDSAVTLAQLSAVIGASIQAFQFNTIALTVAYTVPAGMTITGILMSGSVVGSNAYTYAGTTLTFNDAPDDVYPITIYYK